MTLQEKKLTFQNQARKEYFEGWYFKQVSTDESVILSLIPSMMRNNKEEKAMIQVILALKENENWRILTDKLYFPMSSFSHSPTPFRVAIGNNAFSKEGLFLSLNTPSLNISGHLDFGPFTLAPTSIFSPTIMGPFSYFPLMECMHGLGSLHHTLKGTLQINGKDICFDGGIGYLEKDWGQSFPKSYVWLQSNHFEQRPACLFFSWAHIPLGPFHFSGFICHLWIAEKHFRFATYTGSSCTFDLMTEDKVHLTLKKGPLHLSIEGIVEAKGTLSAPKKGLMDHQIKEGLAGRLSFQLTHEKKKESLSAHSSLAGIEIVPKLAHAH